MDKVWIKIMNFVLVFLISVCLVVVTSEKNDSQDHRYVVDCNLEENVSGLRYTLEELNATFVPKDKQQGCIFDCYFRKRGQIKQVKNPQFIEYAFNAEPLEAAVYGPLFRNMSNRHQNAVNYCVQEVSGKHVEKCWLIHDLRECLNLELHYNPEDQLKPAYRIIHR